MMMLMIMTMMVASWDFAICCFYNSVKTGNVEKGNKDYFATVGFSKAEDSATLVLS